MSVDKLEAFITLLYVRGLYDGMNTPLESSWNEKYGLIPRNRFREITLVSEVWGTFVQNYVSSYKPEVNIAVEEQWFPANAKCSFTQYIPYKQDKWGIKFRLAADVDSKYVLNVFPYLGKDESQHPENVVLRLVEPYLGEGRNVNTDEIFTSLPLANKLIDKNTSLVGVMKVSRGLPLSVSNQAHAELFSTTARQSNTVYRRKPRENVCILSNKLPTVAIGGDTNRKPETLTHYNNTKVGVDKMARQFTVKADSQRWPVAVFYNLLELAAG